MSCGLEWVRCTAALLVAAAAAHGGAAELHVKVIDSSGNPVKGAVVMVEVEGMRPKATEPATLEIRQKQLRFAPAISVVPVGTTVTFTNEDEFDHHVRGASEAQQFEFLIPAAGTPTPRGKKAAHPRPKSVRLKAPGIVRVSCHLHSSMRAHIVVTEAPVHGVTDASGEVVFTELAEGMAALNTWHPLMLTRPVSTVTRLSSDLTQSTIQLKAALPGVRQ